MMILYMMGNFSYKCIVLRHWPVKLERKLILIGQYFLCCMKNLWNSVSALFLNKNYFRWLRGNYLSRKSLTKCEIKTGGPSRGWTACLQGDAHSCLSSILETEQGMRNHMPRPDHIIIAVWSRCMLFRW